MIEKNVEILGEVYTVRIGTKEDFPVLSEADGFCDTSVKLIVVDNMQSVENDIDVQRNLVQYQNEVARHEVLHAFLYESGLSKNTFFEGAWATNEEMIDWFAIKYPRIKAVYKELEIEQ